VDSKPAFVVKAIVFRNARPEEAEFAHRDGTIYVDTVHLNTVSDYEELKHRYGTGFLIEWMNAQGKPFPIRTAEVMALNRLRQSDDRR
jgi:hypothetical protein